jgi:hypothetical protein
MAYELGDPQLTLRGLMARAGIALMTSARHDRPKCSSCLGSIRASDVLQRDRAGGDGLNALCARET